MKKLTSPTDSASADKANPIKLMEPYSDIVHQHSLVANAPAVKVCTIGNLQHSISFDGVVMLNNRTRSGYACELWAMLDEQTGFTYLSTETHSPCTVGYSEPARNKTVAYRLRWIGKQGETSPWSEAQTILIQ